MFQPQPGANNIGFIVLAAGTEGVTGSIVDAVLSVELVELVALVGLVALDEDVVVGESFELAGVATGLAVIRGFEVDSFWEHPVMVDDKKTIQTAAATVNFILLSDRCIIAPL